jgi:hypothetical protein
VLNLPPQSDFSELLVGQLQVFRRLVIANPRING